jgi:hypothetical protein
MGPPMRGLFPFSGPRLREWEQLEAPKIKARISGKTATWRGFIDSELPDRAATDNGHHQTSERAES